MHNFLRAASRVALPIMLVMAAGSASSLAADLSRYRNFHFGTDVSTVAKLTGADPARAKVIHRRPALIEELEWRPQPLGPSSQRESAQTVVFRFYQGELFRIEVNYDRYETEGLTADDWIEAISAAYGLAARPTMPANVALGNYGDREETLAQWEDSQYRFDLIRMSYGPTFKLVGVAKRLEAPAQSAAIEARRLDDREAPERDAARIASEADAAKAKLEKARLINKPIFRM